MAKSMRRFWNTVDVYFAHDRKVIAAGNLVKMQYLAFFVALALLGTRILSGISALDIEFPAPFGFLLITNMVAIVLATALRKLRVRNFYLCQGLVMSYAVIHYAVFLGVSTMLRPDRPDLAFGACLLMMPAIFSISPYFVFGLNFMSTATFIVLAFVKKEPTVMWNDVFSVSLNLVLSFVILFVLTRVRVSNFYNALQLSNLASMDKVGKVYKKRNFVEICENLCELDTVDGNRAMLFFSIDGYEELGEDYGRQTRDEISRIVGQAIAANATDADVVGRIDGDTFALLLNSVDAESELKHIDIEVRRAIRTKARGFTNHEITISAGGVFVEDEGFQYHEIADACEQALYTSKTIGRSTLTVNHLRQNEYRYAYASNL